MVTDKNTDKKVIINPFLFQFYLLKALHILAGVKLVESFSYTSSDRHFREPDKSYAVCCCCARVSKAARGLGAFGV